MKLEEFLISIKDLAAKNGLSEPYIVGGVVRDRILGKIGTPSEIKDIDITTGNKDSQKLGILIKQTYPEADYRVFDDGHSAVNLMGIHIDLSSNFIIPGIDQELQRLGIKDIDDMKREVYSRDFSMNTVLEKLDFSGLYDITKEGIGDIHAGLIRCPIDPNITIGIDARRILRAIKFAVKFDFTIESKLKQAMLDCRKSVANLPPKYVASKMDEIVALNPDKGLDMLIEFKILPLVQLSKSLYDLLIQRRKVIHAL